MSWRYLLFDEVFIWIVKLFWLLVSGLLFKNIVMIGICGNIGFKVVLILEMNEIL